MLQSGHGLLPKNYEIVAKEYENSHVRPVWDGEPAYEPKSRIMYTQIIS